MDDVMNITYGFFGALLLVGIMWLSYTAGDICGYKRGQEDAQYGRIKMEYRIEQEDHE